MKLSRRKFLIGSGVVGGGLLLGFSLPDAKTIPHTRPGSFQPNAWLQITSQGEVIFQLDKAEMGQGVMTSLPTILGEELDYDPANMIVEFAGVNPGFKNPQMGVQITGGSTAVMTGWDPLREAGAAARAMLVAAAAEQWKVDSAQCKTDNGFVVHPNGQQRSRYGDLAVLASGQKVPKNIELKKPEAYRWIGKSLQRFDSADKVEGKTQFGLDVLLPGMKVAVVVRCPQFGGQQKFLDKNSVAGIKGVIAVFPIHSGVAIVAEGYWSARKAANQLFVKWKRGKLSARLNSASILAAQKEALANTEEPFSVQSEGDIAFAFSQAEKIVKAEYTVPYFHHSPMEPQNCTAQFTDGKLELWAPTQTVDIARAVAAFYTGIDQENVTVNGTFLGGGFGRRGYVDFAGEAAAIAVNMPGVPVKLMWSREDDMQHDYYRPATFHSIQAGLDEMGVIIAWQHNLVGTSILKGFGVDLMQGLLPSWVPAALANKVGHGFANFVSDYDITMGEGAKIPYAIENRTVGMVHHDPGVPTGFWRSVSHSFNAFVVEGFINELAYESKSDALQFRLGLLAEQPRHRSVLKLLQQHGPWGKPPQNMAQGIAVHESFGSVVGMLIEVSSNGLNFKVHRVVCAIDCGLVVNRDLVVQQMEGGIIYGLTAAMKPPVTIVQGACAESNFHDLPVLRIDESPEIEVYIVESNAAPGGVGEVAVPPVAPALAHALFAATGKRLRDLPLKLDARS